MNNVNLISNSDNIQISKPWFELKRKLEGTIGADSFVFIGEINYISEFEMEIRITTTYAIKAQSLVNVIRTHFEFDKYSLNIAVFDNEGREYKKENLKLLKKEAIKKNFEAALLTNDLVIGVIEDSSSDNLIIIEIAKEQIQFYDNASTDFYKSNNTLAEMLFREIFDLEVNEEVIIKFTTTLNRDIPPTSDNLKNNPWLQKYLFINSIFKSDYDVTVSNLMTKGKEYFVNVTVNKTEKAEAIATIMNNRFNDKDTSFFINFFDKENNLIQAKTMRTIKSYESLVETFKLAFYSNKFVKFVINLNTLLTDNERKALGDIIIVLNKDVVQFYNFNYDDYYGNGNILASELFKELIKSNFLLESLDGKIINVIVTTTTEHKRNFIK